MHTKRRKQHATYILH